MRFSAEPTYIDEGKTLKVRSDTKNQKSIMGKRCIKKNPPSDQRRRGENPSNPMKQLANGHFLRNRLVTHIYSHDIYLTAG